MSTIVYHNTHSFFDEPRSLSLKLNHPQCLDLSQRPTSTGWTSIESLSQETTNSSDVYVHPMVRRSANALSKRSLEMCTENLGSETGSDVTDADDIFSMLSSDYSDAEESTAARERRRRSGRKTEPRKAGYESLPPPLTTMCGENTLRVQRRLESGRLVMTAVSASPRRSAIRAERSNGRLTMSLVEDFTTSDSGEEIEGEGEEEEEEEELIKGASLEEGKDGINVGVEGKIGIGGFQRPSRCNEGGHRSSRRLINWESYWVAT